MGNKTTDVCILGAGIVGLTTAYQLLERNSSITVTVIEKESKVGKHSSGRNSGVLHAGVYYKPDSLKARVCVLGAKRLKAWCESEKLPVLECGKIITPQRIELDRQLDTLLGRGQANGATVELIDEAQFKELVPDGRTSSGRALWSPETCIVKSILVIQRLQKRLQEKGVNFLFSENWLDILPNKNEITLSNGDKLSYGHLFNCAGLQADRIAHQFNLGKNYTMLPFKGSYWQLKDNVPFEFNTNLYPVPDLEIPFLGVHVTPSVDRITYLGPTATPALGRENYNGFRGTDVFGTLEFMFYMTKQLLEDKKMRRYASEQVFESVPSKFLRAAQEIVPKIKMNHIEKSSKVGIRPQLYDKENNQLVQDFIMLEGYNSTHVINAISPAFTASFELADYILDSCNFNK